MNSIASTDEIQCKQIMRTVFYTNEMRWLIRYIALTSANTVPLLLCPYYEVDNSHPLNEILKYIILSVFFFSFKHHMCVWSMLIFVINLHKYIYYECAYWQ